MVIWVSAFKHVQSFHYLTLHDILTATLKSRQELLNLL